MSEHNLLAFGEYLDNLDEDELVSDGGEQLAAISFRRDAQDKCATIALFLERCDRYVSSAEAFAQQAALRSRQLSNS